MHHSLLRSIVGAATLSVVGAAFAAGYRNETPLQDKYVARSGPDGAMCAAAGPLKDLVASKYGCFGLDGIDKCKASIDATKGTLDAKYYDMALDMMKTAPTATNQMSGYPNYIYAAGCLDLSNANYAHLLMPGLLSYGKAKPAEMAALGSTSMLSNWGAVQRAEYIAAIGRYGEAQKDKFLPVLKGALTVTGQELEFKENALKLLARFGSDDAVDYCMGVLKQGNEPNMTKNCALYLGERKAKDAVSIVARRMQEGDKHDTFVRVLGMIGSKDAVDALTPDYQKYRGSFGALKETAALINIGDKSNPYVKDFTTMIGGKNPTKPKSYADEQLAERAAFESTYVGANSSIDEALRSLSKNKDWPKTATKALSALAQRGDKAAVASLVKLLDSPTDEIRATALDALGGSYDEPEGFPEYVGRKGIAAKVDASVLNALYKFMDNEPKPERRTAALNAIGAVRSFMK